MEHIDKVCKNTFMFIYGHEPTDEQLEIYKKFLLGEEDDIEKVQKICNIKIVIEQIKEL